MKVKVRMITYLQRETSGEKSLEVFSCLGNVMFTGVAGVLTFWRGRFCRLFEKTVMIGIGRLFVFFRAFQMGQVKS